MGLWSVLDSEPSSVLLYLGVAALAKQAAILYGCTERGRSGRRQLVGRVSGLLIHPVKSMGGVRVDQAEVTRVGLKALGGIFDRHYVVVSADEPVALTAKLTTVLASVKTSISGRLVTATAPSHPELGTLTLDCEEIEQTGEPTKEDVILHNMPVKGLDCGSAASAFLDGLLGKKGHRLIYLPPDGVQRRQVRGATKKYLPWQAMAKDDDEVGYQDCTQIMLMAQESQDDLNKRLDFKADFDRFRPNIIAADVTPYDEDTWNEVYIGDCKFTLLKLCGRCLMTCVDTETGKAHPQEQPLKTLRSYRMVVQGFGPCLGINLIVDNPGIIKVGDPIYAVKGPIKLQPGA